MTQHSISPEDLELLVTGYVLGELSPDEAATLETLRQDPEQAEAIANLIAQTQQAVETAYFPAEVAPPKALRQRLMTDFAATGNSATAPAVTAETETATPERSPTDAASQILTVTVLPRWVKLLGALAIAAILGLCASNYALWRSLQAQYRLAAVDSSATSDGINSPSWVNLTLEPTEGLTQLTSAPAAVEVSVQINPEDLKGTLVVENLPPLQPGQVYVLWTVIDPTAPITTDAKGAILTEVFTVEADRRQSQPLVLPPAFQQQPEAVQAIAITVEDAAAPQSHESAPILIQAL